MLIKIRTDPIDLGLLDWDPVDMEPHLKKPESAAAKTARVRAVHMMQIRGCCLFRDPRLSDAISEDVIDMMTEYAMLPSGQIELDRHTDPRKMRGVTLEGQERARNWAVLAETLEPRWRPFTYGNGEIERPAGDQKLRYHWTVVAEDWRRANKDTEALRQVDEDNTIPAAGIIFPNWANNMNAHGEQMVAGVDTAAEMVAMGFDLPKDAFARLFDGQGANSILAPTMCDISKTRFGHLQAAWHQDLCCFSGHTAGTHPGLICWLSNGRPFAVRIPPGCIFVQCGMQAERLLGGAVYAGFHEVVSLPETIAEVERRAKAGLPNIRVATPLFRQVAHFDRQGNPVVIQPMIGKGIRTWDTVRRYPPIEAAEYYLREFGYIGI